MSHRKERIAAAINQLEVIETAMLERFYPNSEYADLSDVAREELAQRVQHVVKLYCTDTLESAIDRLVAETR